MSAFGAIVGYYEVGIELQKEKNYLEAARAFSKCLWHFEYGELPIYSKTIDKTVKDATEQYFKCMKKLTKEQQSMIESEYYTYS